MNSSSYKWGNKSTNKRAKLVTMGMPSVSWKTRPQKVANMFIN